MLDVVEANPRVVCSGGAGTGKTFLALELARRWAASGRTVLVACRSRWLKQWLDTRFALPGVTVSVAAAVSTAARRNGVERFDALIVDEGQDLLSIDILKQLDAVLDGGLERGSWCFFHDIEHNGLSPSGITILSERPFVESGAGGLLPRIGSEIVVLDEYVLRHFPPRHISFARIADFKGLENEAILLIDLPRPSRSGATSASHYVGMSRARSLLDIIWSKSN